MCVLKCGGGGQEGPKGRTDEGLARAHPCSSPAEHKFGPVLHDLLVSNTSGSYVMLGHQYIFYK